MKQTIWLLLISVVCSFARADDLRVSSVQPVIVTAPDQWKAVKDTSPAASLPVETYRIVPPGGRNAICLISILDKEKPEFTDEQFLKKLLRGDSLPYVNSRDDLAKLEIKEMKIGGGSGFIVNFVDPDLIGKPVKKGTYKTATPMIVGIGSKYLIKATVLCDDLKGPDYQDLIKIIESIRIKIE